MLAGLEPDRWDEWHRRFRPHPGHVIVPRVQLGYCGELGRALAGAGMGIAFDPNRADLRGMVAGMERGDLYISRVDHGTSLELNEEGSEAAAATAVEVRLRSPAPPVSPFDVVLDHPFLFAVRDRTTDAILFSGVYTGPD